MRHLSGTTRWHRTREGPSGRLWVFVWAAGWVAVAVISPAWVVDSWPLKVLPQLGLGFLVGQARVLKAPLGLPLLAVVAGGDCAGLGECPGLQLWAYLLVFLSLPGVIAAGLGVALRKRLEGDVDETGWVSRRDPGRVRTIRSVE